MNSIQKITLKYYFKHFILLINFSRWLTGGAGRSRFLKTILNILHSALVKNFYFARQLTTDEALALIEKADRIEAAACVCASATGRAARGGCYYLDEAAEIYASCGPLDSRPLKQAELKTRIKTAAIDRNLYFMTVGQRTNCFFFPSVYVLCLCDKHVCLPWHYQQRFPEKNIVTPKKEATGPWPAYTRLILSLPLIVPVFLYYGCKQLKARSKLRLEIILLTLTALAAGAIISRPEMFAYLHEPGWRLNHYWFVLLPLGLWSEIGLFFGLAWLFLRKKRSAGKIFHLTIRAFLFFELIHLFRFALIWLLRGQMPFYYSHILFWSFDPLAWGVLFFILFKHKKYGP